jgi:hypothetical protein
VWLIQWRADLASNAVLVIVHRYLWGLTGGGGGFAPRSLGQALVPGIGRTDLAAIAPVHLHHPAQGVVGPECG